MKNTGDGESVQAPPIGESETVFLYHIPQFKSWVDIHYYLRLKHPLNSTLKSTLSVRTVFESSSNQIKREKMEKRVNSQDFPELNSR